ncbi:hypothetical protein HU200_043994 [Digitaria exilis]|uniref:Leucine-rich repeat-containing N-terminal plant-type domain-containing protein n=1 Tax=Digitaria exilis TaxID=1010633 RepID=A0A835B555_9POAL|nr:hypothetical protein HU200_043994 [Digitaria exilis]
MAFTGFAITVLLLSLASDARPCSDHEKSSLLRFITGLSLDGGLAMSWRRNGTASCCSWEGIACDGDGAVIEVSLPGRGLQGSISPALGDLTGLRCLNLSHNSLSGGLPSELLASNIIVVLDVSFNQLSRVLQQEDLSSSVPDHRPSLQVLNISSNLFTGEFPSIVWENKSNLVVLNASNNSFQGWMPSSFCISSPFFAELDLSYNQFSGSISPGLGNCSALVVLKAGHNQLSGALPDELFNVSSLEHLAFPNNYLYGALDSVINLRNLAILDLGGNMLNGKIPDSIGKLKRLEEFHLDNNDMSGELTKVNFSTLINLKKLDLLCNNFTGTIPESLYFCSNLNALRLSFNNLHGQLSPRIVNLKSLTFLSLGYNNFTNITNALHVLKDCKNLIVLSVRGSYKASCSLSGKIPLWLSKLKKLEMLVLPNNKLTGPIPAWIKSLKSLFYLDISYNNLAGEIPTSLMEMPMLTTNHLDPRYRTASAFPKVLNLANNNLTGVIPREIGQLKWIDILDLSSNSSSGEIPQQFGSLINLQVLDLSNNHLTGAIPSDLNKLHLLSAFNISNNDLEGPIPTGGQFSTFTKSSFGGNPKLCGIIIDRPCGSTGAHPVPMLSTKQTGRRVAFAIAFGTFFGLGVLYDQIVFSRYFG